MSGSGTRIVVLENRFPMIAAALQTRADAIVAQTAQKVAADARNRAPVDTGELRESIEAHQVREGHWEVTADTRYAGYVEYGTVDKGGPQPFMTPAAHQAEPAFQSDMTHVVPGT